jgi:hypothetical protein
MLSIIMHVAYALLLLQILAIMSRAQAESVIKNIIREIATECATKGQSVSETLVAFIVSQLLHSYLCL